MLLATTQVEDFDRFLEVFSTAGRREAQAARLQGRARLPRPRPRTTASGSIFDWDEHGWQSFVSDPEVPPIMKEAGHKGKPQAAPFAGRCDA